MLAADYGFDKEHVINVALQGARFEVLRAELLRDSRIEEVSAVSIIPGTGDRERGYFHTGDVEQKTLLTVLTVDENFVANLAISVIAGRDFSAEFNDQNKAAILNLSATQKLGYVAPEAAVGQFVASSENQALKIVGVTVDFFHMTLGRIGPMVMICNPNDVNFANVRISSRDLLGAVSYLEETWKRLDPRRPIRYEFYDRQTAAQFTSFRDYVRLIGVGAGFIVFIACLGLLGIATYNAETRIKEVGIRKVLGASASAILVLLSKDFLKLIAIAAVIAAPLTWYLNDQLLQSFAYRTEVGVGVFVIGIALTVLLALLTIASQALKASFSNPVETLKYE
jgi:putative ABC transport system permease protein